MTEENKKLVRRYGSAIAKTRATQDMLMKEWNELVPMISLLYDPQGESITDPYYAKFANMCITYFICENLIRQLEVAIIEIEDEDEI